MPEPSFNLSFFFLLLFIVTVGSTPTLVSKEVVIDFDDHTPSFSLKGSIEDDYFLVLTFLHFEEMTAQGDMVDSWDFSKLDYNYLYTNGSFVNNTLHVQNATFTHKFSTGASLIFQFVVAYNANATSQQEIEVFGNAYNISSNYSGLFFDLNLYGWKFLQPTNTLRAKTFVLINLGGLSLSPQETSTGYTIGMPYYNDYLLADFPKSVLIDGSVVYLTPSVDIGSISQPVSATITLAAPHFEKSLSYSSSFLTFYPSSGPSTTLQVVLIVVGVLVGVIILFVGGGYFLNKMQKEIDEEGPEEEDPAEKEKMYLVQKLQYDAMQRGGKRY